MHTHESQINSILALMGNAEQKLAERDRVVPTNVLTGEPDFKAHIQSDAMLAVITRKEIKNYLVEKLGDDYELYRQLHYAITTEDFGECARLKTEIESKPVVEDSFNVKFQIRINA